MTLIEDLTWKGIRIGDMSRERLITALAETALKVTELTLQPRHDAQQPQLNGAKPGCEVLAQPPHSDHAIVLTRKQVRA
jgi:hypothetical protein